VLETIEPHVPKSARAVVRWRLAGFQMELARNRARRGAFGKAALAVGKALSLDVVAVLQAPQAQLTQRLAAGAGARAPKSHSFLAWPLADADAVWREPSGRLDTLCARLDLEAPTPPTFQGLQHAIEG
jgi:hypothetical protein